MKQLDKSLPHAEVHGGDYAPGDPQPKFIQGGHVFDVHGAHLGAHDGETTTGKAAAATKDGHGNIAHGDFHERLKALEEGGAGGGMTKSYPQTTTKGQEILDEFADEEGDDDETKAHKKSGRETRDALAKKRAAAKDAGSKAPTASESAAADNAAEKQRQVDAALGTGTSGTNTANGGKGAGRARS